MLQVWSCDGITGDKIDLLEVEDASWERLLSARGSGSVTVPLTSLAERSLLRSLTVPWQRIVVIEIDGTVVFGGYVLGHSYTVGGNLLKVDLQDVWTMFGRRGGWNRSHPYTAAWSTAVTGVRGEQAWQAIHRGRNTGLPSAVFPVSKVSVGGGESVTRTVWGYHFEMINDLLRGLMDEGLDIYMQPRWVGDRFDWGFRAGMAWTSGRSRDLMLSVEQPNVHDLSVSVDASRVSTNAARIGEGSEVDMLARSRTALDSPYPALDRITPVKTVSDVVQLDAMALEDLRLYGEPTEQWDLSVATSDDIDLGDVVRIHSYGDAWIADGWHERRVVKVSGGLGQTKKVGFQPVGGA